jgi:hypothetical protein
MQEQEFQKGKEYIVASDVKGLRNMINSGFDVDAISIVENYSLMQYFLMFSQNFERKVVGQVLYDSSKQNFTSKDLLFMGFILLNKSIIFQSIKSTNTNNDIGCNAKLQNCHNWAKDTSSELQNFWNDIIPDLNIQCFSNLELLELGVRIKNLDLVRSCAEIQIKNCNSLNTPLNIRGDALLHIPAGMGCTEIAAILIDLSADINISNRYKWTPLHFATRYGHTETVRFLVNRRADLALKTTDQSTALDIAIKHNLGDIVLIINTRE